MAHASSGYSKYNSNKSRINILKKAPAKINAQIDEDVVIKAQILGCDFEKISWYKHDSKIEINDKYSFSTRVSTRYTENIFKNT